MNSYRRKVYQYNIDLWVAGVAALVPIRPMFALAVVLVWPIWILSKKRSERRPFYELAIFSLAVGLLAKALMWIGISTMPSILLTYPLLGIAAWRYWSALRGVEEE